MQCPLELPHSPRAEARAEALANLKFQYATAGCAAERLGFQRLLEEHGRQLAAAGRAHQPASPAQLAFTNWLEAEDSPPTSPAPAITPQRSFGAAAPTAPSSSPAATTTVFHHRLAQPTSSLGTFKQLRRDRQEVQALEASQIMTHLGAAYPGAKRLLGTRKTAVPVTGRRYRREQL